MEFWHIVTIVISAVLLATGLIMGWYWLVGIGFLLLPVSLIWGLVATGPGSSHNPYHEH
ncbi:MAG: hypothetical protein JOZ39_03715 [Chloroflexi bacterium]|nr:hypothetical protein [Chloroflexota bacterium]